MGNINMNNFVCENYYCQSVSFKPEWLSENTWNINYKYLNDEINNEIKPYTIEKGIFKLISQNKTHIILSKKLLINFNDIKHLSIPINFKFNVKKLSSIDFFLIFSNNEYNLSNNLLFLKEKNDECFYIKLTFNKKYVYMSNSVNHKLFKYNLKTKKNYRFVIDLENNYDMLLVATNLISIIEEKYLVPFNFSNNDHYLNLLINIENDLTKDEYIEFNFE